jgi:hypothetical protein
MTKTKDRRNLEMKRLYFEELWTSNQIAEKYSVSVTRVRQIVGPNRGMGGTAARRNSIISIARKAIDKTSTELAKSFGLSRETISAYRKGLRVVIKGGSAGTGYSFESAVSKKLNEWGIEHSLMPNNHPFDIQTKDGGRLDVKARTVSENSSRETPMYNFNLNQKKRGRYADFFILVISNGKNDFFVIPASETKLNTPIRFCWPPANKGAESKWLQYHNRFDLLKGSS